MFNMSDNPERRPSPVRMSVRERRQVERQGEVSWDDVDLQDGQKGPEPEPSEPDPDYRRSNSTGQAGAARSGHRRQETHPHRNTARWTSRTRGINLAPALQEHPRYQEYPQQWRTAL